MIKEQSAEIALEEAKKSIRETFKENNIQSLIEKEANRHLRLYAEREIRNQLASSLTEIQNEFDLSLKIADAGMRARRGYRSGLDDLLEYKSMNNDPNIRNRAKSYLRSVGEFFTQLISKEINNYDDFNTPIDYINSYRSPKSKIEDIPDLIDLIRNGKETDEIAAAFMSMRYITGVQFEMFNIEQINVWCRENNPKCEEKSE